MRYFKIILGILICLLVSACTTFHNNEKIDDINNVSSLLESDIEVFFDSGTFYNKNWEDELGTYEGSVIPDQETAEDVALSIYKNIQKQYKLDLILKSVFYDDVDEIWIVSFGNKDINYDGLSCSIAMQKIDGKVLRIWFDE